MRKIYNTNIYRTIHSNIPNIPNTHDTIKKRIDKWKEYEEIIKNEGRAICEEQINEWNKGNVKQEPMDTPYYRVLQPKKKCKTQKKKKNQELLAKNSKEAIQHCRERLKQLQLNTVKRDYNTSDTLELPFTSQYMKWYVITHLMKKIPITVPNSSLHIIKDGNMLQEYLQKRCKMVINLQSAPKKTFPSNVHVIVSGKYTINSRNKSR